MSVLSPYVPHLITEWATTCADDRWRPIDGTMVFADLSGFTAMSERLSRLGRVGAEEVTDAIASCFSELLAVAHGVDGSLLKFGGDALLIAFHGDEHAYRAVWAAAAMRERLREVGKLKTSAGNVNLRMSVGVHTGTFDYFLVGAPSRELVVTGTAASQVVAMEHAASAGQILISATTAATLPECCVGDPLGSGFLLRSAPVLPIDLRAGPTVIADEIDLREFVPVAVDEHARAGGGLAEHRVVTVAFVHFGGLDARLVEHGPAPTALELEKLVSAVEKACADNDVALLATDIDADGGKFILTAGAPAVRGHEEKRMLAAARRIVDADLAIPVRIGVNRGPVFAGDVGPFYRRTYTVMGDTVNVAARLTAAAAPGQVVATAPVLERAPSFASSPLPPLQLKGKRAPVEAFDVGAARSSPSPEHVDALELPFVGREIELAHLEARLHEARAGRGSALRVVGPAGIGKTRLLRELRARAPELRCERVTCEAYEIATPYASAGRLLRGVLSLPAEPSVGELVAAVALHAPELEPWIPLLATVLDLDVPDTPETASLAPQYRAARIAATAAALLAAATHTPALVVIDDAEWIDDASREVVETLGTLAPDTNMLLASVARDDETSNAGDVLLVGPLSRQEVDLALRRATEHAPLRPHEIASLVSRADGNPLFLTELWRAAATGDEAEALPDSIEALVTAQLDRLPPALRTILGYASVLGLRFDLAALRELTADEVLLDSETWTVLADFVELQPGDHARFRHGLIRDTAYGKLPFRRRRELHRRAAQAIERLLGDSAHDEAELLSLHYFRAEAYDETWHFARIAGERARARYAFVDAAALLDRAVVAARHLPDAPAAEVAAVREALGDVHDRNGEYERALLDYRATRKLVRGDVVREAELLLKEAWIPERIGRSADAVRAIRKGLRLVDGVSGAAAGRARAQLAVWYAAVRQSQGRRREAIAWCNRALDEARQARDRDAEAHALYTLDWSYAELGQFELADHLPRAAELYAELGDLCGQGTVLNGQGAVAYFRGDWPEALACYERARDAYDRAGSAIDAARAAANIAEVLSDQGRGAEAESLLREALRVSTAAGYRYDIALIHGFLGRTCARSGRFDEAFHYLRAARVALSDTGFHGDVAKIDAWLAETLCHSGDATAALALADATLTTATAEGGISPEAPLLERVRAASLASLGDLEAAGRALAASIAAARARGAQYELAITVDALVRTPALPLHLDDIDALLAERDAVFDRLQVVLSDSSPASSQRRAQPGSPDR